MYKPGGLLTSVLVGSVGAIEVSVSNSECACVVCRSGDGFSVVKTVVSLSPLMVVELDGDTADGVKGAGGASLGTD